MQKHDYKYWMLGASGVEGAFLELKVKETDLELFTRWGINLTKAQVDPLLWLGH